MTEQWHLAQVNVAYARAGMEDALMEGFTARLDEINLLADTSEGFVWRYISDSRDPTQREFDDPLVLFNLTVWTDIDALHRFTYKTAHAQLFAQRKQWFDDWRDRLDSANVALWWIPAGTLPTTADAIERSRHLQLHGPSAMAFTFKRRFGVDGVELA
jgi:hypothetical protein